MNRHYHVLQGMRGMFLPDDNCTATSRKQAESIARWNARAAREDGYRVRGSASSGFYYVGDFCSIEISECSNTNCLLAEVNS